MHSTPNAVPDVYMYAYARGSGLFVYFSATLRPQHFITCSPGIHRLLLRYFHHGLALASPQFLQPCRSPHHRYVIQQPLPLDWAFRRWTQVYPYSTKIGSDYCRGLVVNLPSVIQDSTDDVPTTCALLDGLVINPGPRKTKRIANMNWFQAFSICAIIFLRRPRPLALPIIPNFPAVLFYENMERGVTPSGV